MSRDKSIRLGSSLSNIHTVNQFVEDICDHHNIFNSYFGHILTAVTEAVQNAMMHGNQNDPEKIVTVTFEHTPEGLCFTISDQGNGFDPGSLPDPTDLNNDGLKGRGLFLMKTLADEVSFHNGGNTVELFFNITGIDQEHAAHRAQQVNKYLKTTSTVKDEPTTGKQ